MKIDIVPEDARACHGPCQQGRLPCPTPEACERALDNEHDSIFSTFAFELLAVVAIVAAVQVIVICLFNLWSK